MTDEHSRLERSLPDTECLACLVAAHRLTGVAGALTALAVAPILGVETVRLRMCFLHRRIYEEMRDGVRDGVPPRHDDPA